MPIVYDPAARRIILDSSSVSAVELYSRSADWLAQGDNIKYGAIFRQVGGDDLGGGLSIPPYLFLQGAWRVRPMEASHTLIITGNLFVDGGGVPVVPTLGNYNVSVQYTVPVQAQGIATSGSSGPSASAIADAVWQHASATDLLAKVSVAEAILRNKTVTDPAAGTMTVFAPDGVTPLLVCSLFEDAAGAQPYRGQGAERRERLA